MYKSPWPPLQKGEFLKPKDLGQKSALPLVKGAFCSPPLEKGGRGDFDILHYNKNLKQLAGRVPFV